MRILLTNDDGILAPGLSAMYAELARIADVFVAAPESAQSASAHGITVRQPILASRMDVYGKFTGYSIDGRPADCVKLAVMELMGARPDMVVSGINDGANVSVHVIYSGTVAAAAEGAMLGLPSAAVSLEHNTHVDFPKAARIARQVIERWMGSGASGGRLININIPELLPGRPKGIRVVPQSTQIVDERYERYQRPSGQAFYWLSGAFSEPLAGPETDLHALTQGYVTVTPLQFDLTHRPQLDQLAGIQWPVLGE